MEWRAKSEVKREQAPFTVKWLQFVGLVVVLAAIAWLFAESSTSSDLDALFVPGRLYAGT